MRGSTPRQLPRALVSGSSCRRSRFGTASMPRLGERARGQHARQLPRRNSWIRCGPRAPHERPSCSPRRGFRHGPRKNGCGACAIALHRARTGVATRCSNAELAVLRKQPILLMDREDCAARSPSRVAASALGLDVARVVPLWLWRPCTRSVPATVRTASGEPPTRSLEPLPIARRSAQPCPREYLPRADRDSASGVECVSGIGSACAQPRASRSC